MAAALAEICAEYSLISFIRTQPDSNKVNGKAPIQQNFICYQICLFFFLIQHQGSSSATSYLNNFHLKTAGEFFFPVEESKVQEA